MTAGSPSCTEFFFRKLPLRGNAFQTGRINVFPISRCALRVKMMGFGSGLYTTIYEVTVDLRVCCSQSFIV